MNPRHPNFFIVGAPKCGTTALNDFLGQHPDVFTPPFKEIHYFGSDLTWPNRPSRDEYLRIFSAWQDQSAAGETSVYYLASRNAASEIRAFNPGARAIIMLRNPLDVIHSLYHQVRSNLQEDLDSFEAALGAEERRRRGVDLPPGATKPQQLMYRDTVRFSDQVRRYFDTLGRENVMVVLHEDLEADPRAAYRSVLRFLGVNDQFEPVMRRINASSTYRSEWLQRLVTHPPAWLAKVSRQVLPQELLRRAVVHARSANSRPLPRVAMPADLRRKLAGEMKDDVARLSSLLDRDLMPWVEPGIPAEHT